MAGGSEPIYHRGAFPSARDRYFSDPDRVARRIAWLRFRAAPEERWRAKALYFAWLEWLGDLRRSDRFWYEMILLFNESAAHWNDLFRADRRPTR